MGGGAPTSLVDCTACGAALPTAAKFCSECGTAVPSVADRETRRTVTLLFTDVTGSTALGERLDPEVYRALMGRYFAMARRAVGDHGGTVEKFVGDAVLAVFGLPDVHEDDALRAVRAADDLRTHVTALSAEVLADHGVDFALRTGVNTGAVVTGPARAGGSFATGDAVNTAARLEQAAAPGEILLGSTTYALVRDAVEVEPSQRVSAKGKAEPVPAYRLVRVLDAGHGRRHEDAALVGRGPENRALDDALERTVASGRSHLVTVIGPPGIGKTRLVGEFLTRVGERAQVARGRCVSYGQGITYWPLVQALREALYLVGSESDELTRHALDRALDQAPDRDEVASALMPFLGKAGPPPGKEQTFWAVRRLLEELATRGPFVLTIDDLHWAEPTLLELLERVRYEVADLPLLVLCQARPELLEERPGWGSGALDSMTFGLDPFNPAEIEASVAALLGDAVPEGLAEAVAVWSGGNPLFVEEIVAHLVESGVLQQDAEAGWRVAGELARAELPPTVSSMLASRLGRLPAAERDLLERVSVIGLEFTTADAALLVDGADATGPTELLGSLTRRDLVRRMRSQQGGSWAFKHVLVRDAAYDGLPKALRAELHERFADGLSAADEAEAGAELAGFVAHHLEQAARYRRELLTRGPETEALVERAVGAMTRAAEEARDRERFEDHAAYLQRALRLQPESSATVRGVLAGLADHHIDVDDVEQLGVVLDAFEAALDDTATELDHAFLVTLRGLHTMLAGGAVDPADVTTDAQVLVRSGREAHDEVSVMRGLLIVSVCAGMLGLWRDAAVSCDEIIAAGSPGWSRAAYGMQGGALFYGDCTLEAHRDFVREQRTLVGPSARQELLELVHDSLVLAAAGAPGAHAALDTAMARAEELHAAGKTHSPTYSALVDGYAMARDLDMAIAYAQRVSDDRRSTGSWGFASTDILEQALLMLERGDPAEAVLPLVEEAEGYTSPYDVASVALGTACRAILATRAGDQSRAVRLTTDTLGTVGRTQDTLTQAGLRRWLSEVPRATGDVEGERRMLLEARELYQRKGIRSYDAEIAARLAELGS